MLTCCHISCKHTSRNDWRLFCIRYFFLTYFHTNLASDVIKIFCNSLTTKKPKNTFVTEATEVEAEEWNTQSTARLSSVPALYTLTAFCAVRKLPPPLESDVASEPKSYFQIGCIHECKLWENGYACQSSRDPWKWRFSELEQFSPIWNEAILLSVGGL